MLNTLFAMIKAMLNGRNAVKPAVRKTRKKSDEHEVGVRFAEDVTEEQRAVFPHVMAEVKMLEELDALDYLSGKQFGYLHDLVDKFDHEKRPYYSLGSVLFLSRLASGIHTSPSRDDYEQLLPSIPGWTSLMLKSLSSSLTEAIDKSHGKGRALRLELIGNVLTSYRINIEDLPHKINREKTATIDADQIIQLFRERLEWMAPLRFVEGLELITQRQSESD